MANSFFILPQRNEGTKNQYLCVFATLWQIVFGHFSGFSGLGFNSPQLAAYYAVAILNAKHLVYRIQEPEVRIQKK